LRTTRKIFRLKKEVEGNSIIRNITVCNPHQIFGVTIRVNEMDAASTGKKRNVCRVLGGKPDGRKPLGKTGKLYSSGS
jgi:hypothetical protein